MCVSWRKKSPFVRWLNRTVVLPCLLMWCEQRVFLWANSPGGVSADAVCSLHKEPCWAACAPQPCSPQLCTSSQTSSSPFLPTAQGSFPSYSFLLLRASAPGTLSCLLNCTIKLSVTLKQIRSRLLQSPLWLISSVVKSLTPSACNQCSSCQATLPFCQHALDVFIYNIIHTLHFTWQKIPLV